MMINLRRVDGAPVWVNFDNVWYIEETANHKGATIYFSDASKLLVKEFPDWIVAGIPGTAGVKTE